MANNNKLKTISLHKFLMDEIAFSPSEAVRNMWTGADFKRFFSKSTFKSMYGTSDLKEIAANFGFVVDHPNLSYSELRNLATDLAAEAAWKGNY